MSPDEIINLIHTIKVSKNIILEGVPGTGKTHIIKDIPKYWNNATGRELAMGFDGQGESAITLHPATSYEDFVEGLRPKIARTQANYFFDEDAYSQSDTQSFSYQAGFFKNLVIQAQDEENKNKDFLVLLDEINRCNIPKVMGDLLTTIERSKRGKQSVTLPSKDIFNVPDNIYIIATMNTTDRSVAPLDSALRRRFAFHRLWPKGFEPLSLNNNLDSVEISKSIYESNDSEPPVDFLLSVKLWREVNEKLQKISIDAMLGHSYLYKLAGDLKRIDIDKVYQRNKVIEYHWNHHILPQLSDSLINHGHLSNVSEYACEQKDDSNGISLKITAKQEGQGYLKMPQIYLTISVQGEIPVSIDRELDFDDMPKYVLELDKYIEGNYDTLPDEYDDFFYMFMYFLAKIKKEFGCGGEPKNYQSLINARANRLAKLRGNGESNSIKKNTYGSNTDRVPDWIEENGMTRWSTIEFFQYVHNVIIGEDCQNLAIITKNKHNQRFNSEDWSLLYKYLKGDSVPYILPKTLPSTFIIQRAHNLILEGVPGTGKTHSIESICKDWERSSRHVNGHKRQLNNEYQGLGKAAITLHPASSYEDFIEGLRPNQGQSGFSVQPGFFVRACQDAINNPEEDFLVLLDEINRCNIPKVMGDLLTTIESSKRASYKDKWETEQTITLPYSKNKFFVPNNLYVVATLNTSDRSVAPMDSALRRRFAFQRLWPLGFDPHDAKDEEQVTESILNETKIKNTSEQATHLKNSVAIWYELNEKLKSIGPDAMLGHSYLYDLAKDMKDATPSDSKKLVRHHWMKQIIPQVIDILMVNNKSTKAGDYDIPAEATDGSNKILKFTNAPNHLSLPTCNFTYQPEIEP